MADLNQCTFSGRLGRDPEIRAFNNGDQVANFSIAVSRKWRDKQTNEMREKTTWVRCVANGGLVKVVTDYVKKGSQIIVSGELEERKWVDPATNAERSAMELRVNFLQLLGGRPEAAGGGGQQQQRAAAPAQQAAPAPKPAAGGFSDMDDDIPF